MPGVQWGRIRRGSRFPAPDVIPLHRLWRFMSIGPGLVATTQETSASTSASRAPIATLVLTARKVAGGSDER
jgi:hypothetical protein